MVVLDTAVGWKMAIYFLFRNVVQFMADVPTSVNGIHCFTFLLFFFKVQGVHSKGHCQASRGGAVRGMNC